MATETLVPDGVISSSGLREATVGNLNADDGNWATAKSGTSNGSVLVSFPSPTSNLVLGTDLQTFNAKVRKNNTGTPTARLELWQTGGADALAVGTDTPITSTVGQTISLTWNAALLTLISGADVQAKVVFIHSGSTSVDVGYIEWVDNFGGPATVGAVDGTFADIALSAVGALALTGTLAVALASLSLNGSGQKPTDHTGTSSVTLGSLTGTLTGALSHEGTVDVTLGNVTLSSSGTIIQPTFDPVLNSGISAVTWSYGKPDSIVRGAYTGARSSILNPWAPRWKAHVELPVAQGEAQARTIRSFIAQRTGRLVSFRLPATAVAQNNNTGVSLSSDAAKGATSISISGAATPLKDGQMISVNGQLLCCVADQSGSTLTFLPPLRAAATTGTIVVTSRPYARMFLANSASGWSVGARRLFKFTLDVEEAILVHDDPPPETLKNTGHLTKTLSAASLSATGQLLIKGSMAKMLGALGVSSHGNAAIHGSLSGTLASLSISAAGQYNFRSTDKGVLLDLPNTAGTSIGSTVSALSIYSHTDYDPLTWKQDNATILVPTNPSIGLVRLFTAQDFDTQGVGLSHRKWDGASYSSFVGKGFSQPNRNAGGNTENNGVAFSSILSVSGGEKFQSWREQTGSANAINDRNWFGAEVLPSTTRYTLARMSGTDTAGTTRVSIAWNGSDLINTLGSHNPAGAHPEQFVVPSDTTGLIRVTATAIVQSSITGSLTLWVTQNGTDKAKSSLTVSGTIPRLNIVSPILAVSPGDIITIDRQCSASGAINGGADATWACIEELPSSHRYCLVQKSASQSIPSLTDTVLAWDGVDIHDPENLHDPTTNNGQILVPTDAAEARITYGFSMSIGGGTSWCSSPSVKPPGAPTDGNGNTLFNSMGNWFLVSGISYLTIRAFNGNAASAVAAGTTFGQVEFR